MVSDADLTDLMRDEELEEVMEQEFGEDSDHELEV